MKHPPCKQTPHTQIWDMLERLRALPDKGMEHPADDAGLGAWWIHAPWMSCGAWHWHYVSVVHLRDLPGQSKPPKRLFPEATHEVVAFAIDPACHIDPEADQLTMPRFLAPISIGQQFTAANDAEALALIERCLDLVVAGNLTVESHDRSTWAHLLLECEECRKGLAQGGGLDNAN